RMRTAGEAPSPGTSVSESPGSAREELHSERPDPRILLIEDVAINSPLILSCIHAFQLPAAAPHATRQDGANRVRSFRLTPADDFFHLRHVVRQFDEYMSVRSGDGNRQHTQFQLLQQLQYRHSRLLAMAARNHDRVAADRTAIATEALMLARRR